MGLDMYLCGNKYLMQDFREPENDLKEDGYRVCVKELDLGYWRKHPNLHGYIVNTFAKGVDECQRIELSKEDIENIVEAIESNELPHTDGFFFGASDGTERERDLEILNNALKWLSIKEDNTIRSIYYQASW